MSILEHELLQGYIFQPEYLPGDFKPYTDYCRIKLKINHWARTSELVGKRIQIKFYPNNSIYSSEQYTDAEINEIKKIPIYYTVGTYETWRTGSNAEDAGGGWDYLTYRKNNLYKWKRCYLNSDCYITLTNDLFQKDNKNIYIYLSGGLQTAFYETDVSWLDNSTPLNIEVKSDNNIILGTYGINDLELEGNLCSLLYGNDKENWVWGKTEDDMRNYPVSFQNSDFTSVKNLILNDLNTLKGSACSYMFSNNRYLKNIPDCMNQIYFSKLKKNNVYYRMFENCNSLEKISLNITEDASAYMVTPYVDTFASCNSLRNINITYNYDKTTHNQPCGLRSCVYTDPFGGCQSVEKISFNMDSPFDSNNADYGSRYFADGNNLFDLGRSIGSNIKTKYVTFPKFIDGRKSPETSVTDNDLAAEGARYVGYYGAGNYWSGAEDWKAGHPNNPSMSDAGLGDSENSSLRTIHLFLGTYTGAEANYFGRLNNIPSDTIYSGLINRIHNFSKVDRSSNDAPYPVVSIGSIDVFAFDEYIIGSVRSWDSGVSDYTTMLYKLYDCDSETYVKVTDAIENSTTLCFRLLA